MRIGIALAALGILIAAPALGSGAWTTYLRTYSYSDLLAEGDTVWCATGEAGLLRYDRASGTFTATTREPGGLASNVLTVLARDPGRRLWVGTQGQGVSRFVPATGGWDLLNRFDGLPSDSITVLTAVGDTMWIGTTGGIALWNGRVVAGALPDGVNPSPFDDDWITGIVQRGDSLWIATRRSFWVSGLSGGLVVWQPFRANLPGSTEYRALVTDGAWLYTLSTGGGVFRRSFTDTTWGFVSGGLGTVRRLTVDRGQILASSQNGIHVWNGSGWTTVNPDLASSPSSDQPRSSYAVAVDEQGRHVAGAEGGLAVEPAPGAPRPWPVAVPDGPPGNEITNLALEGGQVYVATFTDGIGRLDAGTGRWRIWPPSGCSGGCDTTFTTLQFLFALDIDRRGHKWFATWLGVVEELDDRPNPPQVTHHVYGPPPLDLRSYAWASALDSLRGGLWFGMDTNCFGCQPPRTPLGLVYYDRLGRDSLNLRQDSLQAMRGTKIHALTVDRTGRVWIGYSGEGIQYLEWPSAGSAIAFSAALSGTEDFNVQGLVALGDTIWAMNTREVRLYGRASGADLGVSWLLPSVPADLNLHPLAVGRDRVAYAGSSAGLQVRRPDGTLTEFTVANSPLAHDAVRAVRIHPVTGEVWIGTASGLNRYDPAYTPPPPPPVPELDVRFYPNPTATSRAGFALRVQGNASAYEGVVLDLGGREVHRFRGVPNRAVVWDGRHQGGARVPPGIYFVRVAAGGTSAIRRVVVMH